MMEIAKLIESEIGDFFAGFGHPGEPETPEEMQSQLLARVMPLLAGLKQEPVAYYFPGGEREIEQVSLPDDIDDGQKANCIPLYAAPQLPQPAVEKAHNSVIAEQLAHVLSGMKVTSHERAVINCAVDRLNKNAAMLQGAEPVSQPYTLRDGWVAVPVEPTAEMIEATFAGEMELQSVQHQMRNRERRAHYYRAMLAAAPPQEVKSALEMGMARYGDAMQKLADGGD